MSDVVIYHNPRCSKSRQTLQLLEEQGLQPTVILYLDTPPNADQLQTIIGQLGLSSARELMRTKESEYKELGLNQPELSEQQLIEGMLNCPRLIERPIVVSGQRAAIGRPPEAVLEIL
ncbi:arsenate reductase (glutaredoxin) [Aestuariirhabdus sp. Z084]|uniref:arsenate reductase (glutaredoxin) n=1 Tax=Aestuariirhabdus haliotis TaxID=2918751 RepID=UPI00201B3C9F|nr:arsenate reductase (glutaredoxin) [Aestuariirhabdus haliotis]MCL6416303.1 arsenate reductase (glutaredoxin) [Aestuariirhabdus haliotis]MCL6420176.1 arsenate reductase (glutaredoxin) [Aestuariirhabdus haliotis]